MSTEEGAAGGSFSDYASASTLPISFPAWRLCPVQYLLPQAYLDNVVSLQEAIAGSPRKQEDPRGAQVPVRMGIAIVLRVKWGGGHGGSVGGVGRFGGGFPEENDKGGGGKH